MKKLLFVIFLVFLFSSIVQGINITNELDMIEKSILSVTSDGYFSSTIIDNQYTNTPGNYGYILQKYDNYENVTGYQGFCIKFNGSVFPDQNNNITINIANNITGILEYNITEYNNNDLECILFKDMVKTDFYDGFDYNYFKELFFLSFDTLNDSGTINLVEFYFGYIDPVNYTITEGENITFDSDSESYVSAQTHWFLDGILKFIGDVWTWITGGNDQGIHEIYHVINNSTNSNLYDEYEYVEVLNYNEAPVINSITLSQENLFYNVDYYVSCEISDVWDNTSYLSVEIQYNNGDGWVNLSTYYSSGNVWISENITPYIDSDIGDIMSYRCRGTDSEIVPLTSDWYYLNNYKTIISNQSAPTTPQLLKPDFGLRKYNIPIVCAGSTDINDDVQRKYYELYVRKNSTSWELIRNQSDVIVYSYNINNDGFNTTYDFTCRAWDGLEYSNNITNINATIKNDIPVFSIINTMDTPVYINGKTYSQGFFVDISALGSDYFIYKMTGECNGDGIIDYVKDTNYKTMDKAVFNCINQEGLIKHTAEAYIFKNNTDEKWTQICTNLPETQQYCKLSKTYEVTISE